MFISRIYYLCFFYGFGLFCLNTVQAQDPKTGIYITVDQAQIQKSPTALPPFKGSNRNATVRVLYNTIERNLDINSFFQLINKKAFLEDTKKIAFTPHPQNPNGFRFENWKKIGTEFLILGQYQDLKSQFSLNMSVYHIPQSKLIFQKTYKTRKRQARLVAHTFSNDLFKVLTGQEGLFLSQIVVSSDRGGNQWREIYLMDWDGHNIQRLTQHRSISISPTWSPDGKAIAYSSYTIHRTRKGKFTNLDLLLMDITSRRRRLLSGRRGINSGAVFHPNGQFIYLTLTQGGNADIFRVARANRRNLKRITKGPYQAMNVEPSVSPNGKKIAFSSDRSGRPMIYLMNTSGTSVKRLTFAGRYNSSPVWSPDGKWLAFAGSDRGFYDIFLIRPDGSQLQRLTSAKKKNGQRANNEEPTFSPDSRHVMFTSDRTGKKQLYIIGIDGTNEKRVTFDDHNYYKPKWGPSRSKNN